MPPAQKPLTYRKIALFEPCLNLHAVCLIVGYLVAGRKGLARVRDAVFSFPKLRA